MPGRRRLAFFLAAAVPCGLVAVGHWYYGQQVDSVRADKYDELRAVADLKVDQIVRWRLERLMTARQNASSDIREGVLRWLPEEADARLKAAVLADLEIARKAEAYAALLVVSPEGRILLSTESADAELDPMAEELVARTVATKEAAFGDFFRCGGCKTTHLDVGAPILDETRHPVAVLIHRVEPAEYLYPLIQAWPLPSRSGETLLVRREGDDVLYLNALRHRPDAALTLRIPLSQAAVPAVQAVLGHTGEFEGPDYRGAEVLADIRTIPGSPWCMVVKIDGTEIRARARQRTITTGVIVVLAMLLIGVLGGFAAMMRQRRLLQDRYCAELERREILEEMRAVFYGIGDAVITASTGGRVTRMNRVAEQLTGWTETQAVGQPIAEIFRTVNETDPSAIVESPWARALETGEIVHLAHGTLLIAKDGAKRPIDDSASPVRNARGEVSGVVLVFRDVSQRKMMEAQLLQSQKLEAIGTLASGVAHEINNTLHVVLGLGSLAEERIPPTDPVRSDIREIVAAAKRGKSLVEDLLGFARKSDLRKEHVSPNELVNKLVDFLRRTGFGKIAFQTALAPNVSFVMGDANQLSQALLNLVTNAQDAIPDTGTITISTSEEVVDPTGSAASSGMRPGRYVKIEVMDDGTGMDESTRRRAFDPFFTTKDIGEGSGLGLSMVHGIVRDHHGSVTLKSAPGKGTTVTVLLPAAAPASRTEAEPPAVSRTLRGGGRVLVVDDDRTILEVERQMLQAAGFEAVVAEGALAALTTYEQHRGQFDLILLDLSMPGMDGAECFRRLREIDTEVRVVIVTGYVDSGRAKEIVRQGALGVILKPFGVQELAEAMSHYIPTRPPAS